MTTHEDRSPDFLDAALSTVFLRMDGTPADLEADVALLRSALDSRGPEAATPPTRIGRYEIESVLGRGGISVVYRAHDTALDRVVALKLLSTACACDPHLTELFAKEALVASQLLHPGIVPVFDVGTTEDDRCYYTMALVKGRPMQELLANEASADGNIGRRLSIVLNACRALAYAHEHGVVHGDIKPGNILVGTAGETYLLDWGFGRHGLRGIDDNPLIVGTPSYMAPEQASGDTRDARTDVFGLGGILCEILTGQPPYLGGSGHEVYLHAKNAWQDEAIARLERSGASAQLIALTRRCLAPAPEHRPAHAGVVGDVLAAFLQDADVRARRLEHEAVAARARARSDANARRLGIALVLLVLVMLGLAVYWERHRLERQHENGSLVRVAILEGENFLRDTKARRAHRQDIQLAASLGDRLAGVLDFADRSGVDADLRKEADSLRQQLKQLERETERDLDFANWLGAVAPHLATRMSKPQIDTAFTQRFAAHGIRVTGPAAERRGLTGSRIGTDIAVGLEEWAHLKRRLSDQGSSWRTLIESASLADPDPKRVEIREAWARADQESLRRLALDPEVLAEPLTASALARHLGWYDRKRAIDVRRHALIMSPDSFELSHDLADSLRRSPIPSHREIVELARMGVAQQPHSAHAHADLAFSLLTAGRASEAEPILAYLRQHHPDYTRAWTFSSQCAAQRGDALRALEFAKRALEESNNASFRARRVTSLLMELGRLQDARSLLRRCLQKHPEEGWIHAQLGVCASRQGTFKDAVLHFERAVESPSGKSRFAYQLASARKLAHSLEQFDRTEWWRGAPEPQQYSNVASAAGQPELALDLYELSSTLGNTVWGFEPACEAITLLQTTEGAQPRRDVATTASRWLQRALNPIADDLKSSSVKVRAEHALQLSCLQHHEALKPLWQERGSHPGVDAVWDELQRLRRAFAADL